MRDKIISKIRLRGEEVYFRQVSGQEKLEFLFKKLVEEALEFEKDNTMEELADVQEVIEAIYQHLWWTKEQVEAVRLQKLEKNGGFQNGDILQLDS